MTNRCPTCNAILVKGYCPTCDKDTLIPPDRDAAQKPAPEQAAVITPGFVAVPRADLFRVLRFVREVPMGGVVDAYRAVVEAAGFKGVDWTEEGV